MISLTVNGKTVNIDTDETTPLLYVLRDELQLNGPKFGCGMQQCGACMVLLDGKAVPSCTLPVASVQKMNIQTLEGLASSGGDLHPVQQAFLEEQAAQCGYCLNGMVMNAVGLLNENPKPSEQEIREQLQINICRCGTHSRILKAILKAAGHEI